MTFNVGKIRESTTVSVDGLVGHELEYDQYQYNSVNINIILRCQYHSSISISFCKYQVIAEAASGDSPAQDQTKVRKSFWV